jgi:ElaB/YqjD/DUF883 family membrane-anchored ribosome-binding protein
MSNSNGNTTEHIAQEANEELQELGRELHKRAEDARKEVVKQLNAAASTIRKEANEAKATGEVKASADSVAKGLEKAAHYLNSRSVDRLGEDAVRVVRKNSMTAVIIAFVIGLLIGLMMRGDNK